MLTNSSINQEAKKQAALQALEELKPGQLIGLGTGSTVFFFLEALGKKIAEENFPVLAIASSSTTEALAQERGIPLMAEGERGIIDIVFDGADEIDSAKNMIKGGGGALFREKILAFAAKKRVIMVDPTKCVDIIGRALLPLEILPWAPWIVEAHLKERGFSGHFRKGFSDNGHLLFDLDVPLPIDNPSQFEAELKKIPGILETGLFYGLDPMVIVGHPDGRREIR